MKCSCNVESLPNLDIKCGIINSKYLEIENEIKQKCNKIDFITVISEPHKMARKTINK